MVGEKKRKADGLFVTRVEPDVKRAGDAREGGQQPWVEDSCVSEIGRAIIEFHTC